MQARIGDSVISGTKLFTFSNQLNKTNIAYNPGAPAADEEDNEDEDVDCDDLPFKIYKIEGDNALTISKEFNSFNCDKIREKYDIDQEVGDSGVLEEFFEGNDENDDYYFFIENKACFAIYYGKLEITYTLKDLKNVKSNVFVEYFCFVHVM